MAKMARAELTIAAPIDLIWEIMLDLKGYAVWNPFITRVLDGERNGHSRCLPLETSGLSLT